MSDNFKALIVNQEGDKFTREVKSINKDFLKHGDVLVKVEYSALNYKDALILKNGAKLVKEFPHIPGIDFSGKVVESKSDKFKEGDEIISILGFQLSSASSIKNMLEYIENIDKKSIEYEVRRNGEIFNLSGPPVDLPRISGLVPLSAAVEASLNAGDVILEINGEPINKFNQLKEAVEKSAGSPINLTVWREEKIFQTTIMPKREDIPQPEGGFITKWRIGIIGSIYPFELLTESIPVLQAIKLSFFQTYSIITSSINGRYHIIAGNICTCNLSGPIEIAEISSHMAKEGLQSFIQTLALFSAAIGFMNLLPIPVLDGGHLVFFAYEAIFKKPPNQKAFSALMTVGFAFILFFMMFAIFNDYFC